MGPRPKSLDDIKRMTDALQIVTKATRRVAKAEEELAASRDFRTAAAHLAYDSGATYDQIAEAAGVSRDGVRKWFV